MKTQIEKTDEQWRAELTPAQYGVLRRSSTELPFTGDYVHITAAGMYRCAACDADLFSSEAKFDSGTGWPSFTALAAPDSVELRSDRKLLIRRTEVKCATCGGHLGHVFGDGPAGGDRYCINSVALAHDPPSEAA